MKKSRPDQKVPRHIAESERRLRGWEFFCGGDDYENFCDDIRNEPLPFRERVLTVKAAKGTYRLLHTWEKAGLLDPLGRAKPRGRGWKRFNLFDIVRLRIFDALRRFGIPLRALKSVNAGLTVRDTGEKGTLERYEESEGFCLYYLWIGAMGGQNPILAVFDDGTIGAGSEDQYLAGMDLKKWPPHVALPLAPVFRGAFPGGPHLPEAPTAHAVTVSSAEWHILLQIRRGDLDRLNVLVKQGRPERMTLEQRASAPRFSQAEMAQLIEGLKTSGEAFEDVRIVTNNHRPTLIRRSRSVKP